MEAPSFKRLRLALLAPLALLMAIGCSSKSEEKSPPPKASAETQEQPQGDSASAEVQPSASSGPVVLGNMLEPFDPPPLEELIANHKWVDRPVVDSMKRMREHQANLPKPKLSAKEALALRNDSPENNELIVDTLGRLAPEDGAGVNYDEDITFVADGDINSTNPLLTSSVVEADYHSFTGINPFSFDWTLKKFADADVAVSWQTSEDRMIDKVVLRDDLTWSDGTPITAHDIAFTFQAIMTEQVIVPAIRQGTDKIRWIEAYDDHTVVYFHQDSLSTNETNLNFPTIPKHIYENTITKDPTLARSAEHTKYEDAPVVGGQYTLTKRVRGQEFVLERREDYYMHNGKQVRAKPYFKTVRYKVIEDRNTALLALKSGDLDSLMLMAEQWNGQTGGEDFYRRNTKVSGLEWTSFHFCWNLKTPYFSDARVRKAMSYAVDYDELLGTILYGIHQPCRGNFHPTSRMFPKDGPKPYQQDLDRAEELLDEAGWEDSDGDGIRDKLIDGKLVPFEFSLMVANMESRIIIATLMKECLDSIGITCHVKPTEFTVLLDSLRNHKFQSAFGGWSSGADPDTNSNVYGTDAGRNYGGYSNPRIDELFQQARLEFDEDQRYVIYGEIHKQLWEDQPYTWLYNRNAFYGFSKKLRGYNFSPRGPFHYGPGISSFYMPVAVP